IEGRSLANLATGVVVPIDIADKSLGSFRCLEHVKQLVHYAVANTFLRKSLPGLNSVKNLLLWLLLFLGFRGFFFLLLEVQRYGCVDGKPLVARGILLLAERQEG